MAEHYVQWFSPFRYYTLNSFKTWGKHILIQLCLAYSPELLFNSKISLFWDAEAKVRRGAERTIMNSYCVSYLHSLSLSLLLPLFLSLCLLIVHVTMFITQLLISFGLTNSSADPSEAAGWNLPSMTGVLCVCMCVYPQYRKTPTHWERAPHWLPSWKSCPSDETLRRRTLTVRNVSLTVSHWE